MRQSTLATAAVVVFAFAALSAGQTPSARVAGKLTKIEGKKLTITDGGKDTVITCNDATKYGRDGGVQASLGDLKVGQSVRAYVTAENVALSVFIAGAASPSPAPTPTPAPTPSPQPMARVAGTLTHIAGKALTITDGGKDTVITCNDATKYGRDGGVQASFGDLKVGQSVRAYVTAENVALNVIIAGSSSPQPPTPSPQPPVRVAGVLTHIAGKALTITDGGKDTVITCNEATKYVREGGGQASFEDLKVGQSVRAYVAAGNVALYVSIPKAGSTPPSPTPAPSPQPAARVAGILAHIAGRVLTITEAGKDTVITCNDATKYGRDGGGQAGFEDLKVGQSVRAYVTADNVALNVFIAKSASPPAPPEPIQPAPSPQPTGRVAGVLTHVAGKALTIITVSETAATATVITCNDATKFYREADGKRSAVSFDALQVGQPLRAYYSTGMIAGVVIIVQVTAAQ